MKLPDQVMYVIKKIMSAGGQAYLVGGALRDFLLGRAVYDYDIAASLTPDETEEVFAEHKTYTIGKRFGTITVLIDNLPIEITTFRGEDSYTDSRHPDKVVFISDIDADLSRRDFTINAMAYNPYLEKAFVDPYNGRADLDCKLIRTVGTAELRFTEDPLRIMRGIRFAAQLDFELDKTVLSAITKLHHLLEKISVERIKDELTKLLLAEEAGKGLNLLQNTGVLSMLFNYDEHTNIIALDEAEFNMINDISNTLIYRLSSLLSVLLPDISNTKNLLQRLRFDNSTVSHVLKLLNGYRLFSSMDITPYSIRKFLGQMGLDDAKHILRYNEIINPSFSSKYQLASELLSSIIKAGDPVFFNQLAITGDDVIKLGIGITDGKKVGEALRSAYDWVLESPENNKREILLMMLKDKQS